MKRLTVIVAATIAAVCLPMLWLQGNLLFSSDLLHEQIAYVLETKRMLATGTPWWSWNTCLGADFIGSYAFYTATSPFVWLACLFPASAIGWGMMLALVLKVLCLAWLSRLYLLRMGVGGTTASLGAYLFTFSSFSIGSLYYFHFYEPVIAFLLLLLAVERLLRGGRWARTAVALATFVVVTVNFYFAVGSLVAALIYVLLRAGDRTAGIGWQKTLGGLAAVAAGILLAAALLVPVACQMMDTTRAAGESAALDARLALNLIERLRTLFMPKVVEGVTAWVPGGSGSFSNEAAVAVVGTALFAAYIVRHRDWLQRLGIVLLVLYLSPLGGVFSLFTDVMYTRWAYFLTLMVTLATARVIDEMEDGATDISRPVTAYAAVAVTVVAALAAGVLWRIGGQWPGVQFAAVVALFAAGVAVTVLWSRRRLATRWLMPLAVVAVTAQAWLFLLNLRGINHGADAARYLTYRASVVPRGDSEPVTCRSDFRAPDDDFLSFNLGLLANRPSTSCYHSVIPASVDSLYRMATRHRGGRNKLRADTLLDEWDALLNVAEVYDIDGGGTVTRRTARWPLPFGSAYDTFITRSAFDSLAGGRSINLPALMLSSLVVEDADAPSLSPCLRPAAAVTVADIDSVVAARRARAADTFAGTSRGFTSTVTMPQEGVICYSVPFSTGFTATVDGHTAPLYKANVCMTALRLPAGRHRVEVTYTPHGLHTGLWLSVAGLLMLAVITLADCYNQKKRHHEQ